MIETRSLAFAYPSGPAIFSGFNWSVKAGEAWAILGPSGCGKSTLLYLLAGLRRPTAGQVMIEGQVITRPRPRTGLVLQDFGLLPWATCEENISLGLEDVRHHYPAQLSGGQRQRTAIARTLALNPDLLLMDEPFASLDAPTREGLQNLTLELRAEQRLTTIVVTHAIEEAAFLGRRILLLGTGIEIIENPEAGTPDYRGSVAYQQTCQHLRARLGEANPHSVTAPAGAGAFD